MSDKVKIIIEIPKELYENKKGYLTNMDAHMICKAVQNGIPLNDVKAEIDEQYDRVHPYNIDVAQGLEMALGILDNIDKAESEETDGKETT